MVKMNVHGEALANIERYEQLVRELEKNEVRTGRALFYGNSFFVRWKDGPERMVRDLPGEKPLTVNHGFGGATGPELKHYYPRLVRPYRPRLLFWTEGSNDFYEGYTVEEAFEAAKWVFDTARADFPGIRLVLLSSINAPADADRFYIELGAMAHDLKNEYDALLREYAESHENCEYWDRDAFCHEDGDTSRIDNYRDIFEADMVHLTAEGYLQYEAEFGERYRALIRKIII